MPTRHLNDSVFFCQRLHYVFAAAEDRVAKVNVDDLSSVAAVPVPLIQKLQLMAQFDEHKQAWVFSSANPNLRVMANFCAEVAPGLRGFGFAIGEAPSFVQVV